MTKTPYPKNVIGIIENTIGDSSAMDPAIAMFDRLAERAHGVDLERRRSLVTIANSVAGCFAAHLGGASVLTSIGADVAMASTAREDFNKRVNPRWATNLLNQDPIRGPTLIRHPSTSKPSDFTHHLGRRGSGGYGAVDLDVPKGTPLTSIAAFVHLNIPSYRELGGKSMFYLHTDKDHLPRHRPYSQDDIETMYRSLMGHLEAYSPVVNERNEGGWFTGTRGMSDIIALSGDSGRGPPPTGYQEPHLHLMVRIGGDGEGKPGIDPFYLGLDRDDIGKKNRPLAGRPVYWDARTPIYYGGRRDMKRRFLDSLDGRLKDQDEIRNEAKKEILARQNDLGSLREYLGREVLQKHIGPDRRVAYKYLPGSEMYSLMLSAFSLTARSGQYTDRHKHVFNIVGNFIAMLPFPSPYVAKAYEQANPGLSLKLPS